MSLSSEFTPTPNARIILCSPLKRALETAFTALAHLVDAEKAHTKIIAWPELRECGICRASQGTKKVKLERWAEYEFGDKSEVFNFNLLEDGWETNWECGVKCPHERANNVRFWLDELITVMHTGGGLWNGIAVPGIREDEKLEILLVSHAGFLKYLTYNPKGEFLSMVLAS